MLAQMNIFLRMDLNPLKKDRLANANSVLSTLIKLLEVRLQRSE
jgi:hypothetical protein